MCHMHQGETHQILILFTYLDTWIWFKSFSGINALYVKIQQIVHKTNKANSRNAVHSRVQINLLLNIRPFWKALKKKIASIDIKQLLSQSFMRNYKITNFNGQLYIYLTKLEPHMNKFQLTYHSIWIEYKKIKAPNCIFLDINLYSNENK